MAHANFQVATKALFIKQGKIFTLTTPNGYVDFPGGRLDDTEYEIPLKEGLVRELAEELGDKIKYNIKSIIFASKRDYAHFGQHHIVALFYLVDYLGGEFELSDEHEKWEWLTPAEILKRKDNFQSGTEFDEFKEYCTKEGLI